MVREMVSGSVIVSLLVSRTVEKLSMRTLSKT
jgi:hypothetical protein